MFGFLKLKNCIVLYSVFILSPISPCTSGLKMLYDPYDSNSNSNWTFIALNLPKQEDSKAQQNKKQSTKFCVQGHNRGRTPRRTPGGWFRLGWICFGVQVGFKLFSEGGQGWRGTNHIRESIPHSRSIKRKTITKLFDRFMNRGAELWNN